MKSRLRKHGSTTASRSRIIADERNTRIKSMQPASFCGSDVFHRREFRRRQVVKLINEAVNLRFLFGGVCFRVGGFGLQDAVDQVDEWTLLC